jgi:hypothetical protein
MSWMPAGAVDKDVEHLNLLATFHYIVGAITAVLASFPLIHVFIGLVFMLAPQGFGPDSKQFFPARMFGMLFFVIGSLFVLFGWTLGVLNFYAARCIKKREKYTLCLVVACLDCMQMPFGTALGVFTLIVLLRDSVKQMFGATGPRTTAGQV